MNQNRIKGNWKELQGRARKKWSRLTDSDLELLQGKADELIARIEKVYGITAEEARQQVQALLR